MKKILLTILSCGSAYSVHASGNYSEDGYHTQIPCFRFAVKTPSGVDTKFDYILNNAKGEKLQSGQVTANKANSNIIQWCDNGLDHVQKKGNLSFDSNYALTLSGIKYKDLVIGTNIIVNTTTKASSFINNYSINSMSAAPFILHDKTIHVGEVLDIRYNDILKLDNASFQHAQFGTQMHFSPYICAVSDPACGDNMNYKPSDSRTWWGFSLFRKTWLKADLTIPENISNYHQLNTRNLKIEDTAQNFDPVYALYDKNDTDTNNLIQLNIVYNNASNPNHVADNLRHFFSGFCSGIGVIDGIVYASCRTDKDISHYSNIDYQNVVKQIPTYLSYKTACQTISYREITSSLLVTDTNNKGAIRCDSYRSDFPQGEYLQSCPGINYKPDTRELITDCYNSSGAIKHNITKLGVLGTTTPHYKNVNGSLIAY